MSTKDGVLLVPVALVATLAGCGGYNNGSNRGSFGGVAAVASFASESGTVQISEDGSKVFALGKGITGAGSLTTLRVTENGQDTSVKLGEVTVGTDPASVSVNPQATRAYVTNNGDNTVTVIDLLAQKTLATIPVGAAPRGTALDPTGRRLFVANQSDGTLSVIDTDKNSVLTTIALVTSGNDVKQPYAVTVTKDTVYVSDFYARPRAGLGVDRIEGFDDGKEGRIALVDPLTLSVLDITKLDPMLSGFTADRTKFSVAGGAANDTFKSTAADPTKTPAKSFFNQLSAISVDHQTGKLYVNAIGASPEPPVNFNTNVQALVGTIAPTGSALTGDHVNLNNLIKVETQPQEPFNGSLTRAFAGDTVDMCVRNGTVIAISRAGSYALRGRIDPATGKIVLDNGPTTPAVRMKTGNIPNGVVMNASATRAYVNAEVDRTISVLDLGSNQELSRIACSDLPQPGSVEQNALIGKLVFFTGMGVQPTNLVGKSVRSIDTHEFRGLASDNNWSSCASCHPDGLSDQVTWIFPTGPRQTLPLDASYSRRDPQRQRVFNWNAVQGSVTDFNNNSRGVQGGKGFTPLGATDAAQVFNHGPNLGVSDALDLETLWVQIGIRTQRAPSNLNQTSVAAGRVAFKDLGCVNCHGGDQWTSSQVRWAYPLFPSDPGVTGGVLANDPRVQQLANGPVLLAFDADRNGSFETPVITRFLNDVGAAISPTFDATNPIELRGAGAQAGKASVGAAGSFNPPSLLGLGSSAPYGHHGRAQTLDAVFQPASAGGLGHPTNNATAQQLNDLSSFLRSIDGTVAPVTTN